MSDSEAVEKQAILRKFILNAPPGRLSAVIGCLRVLSSTKDGSAPPPWFEEALPAFAMEHCLSNLVTVRSFSSTGLSKIVLADHVHVDTVLRRCIGPATYDSAGGERADVESFFVRSFKSVPKELAAGSVLLSVVIDFEKNEFALVDAVKQEVVSTMVIEAAAMPRPLAKLVWLWDLAKKTRHELQDAANSIIVPTLCAAAESAASAMPIIDASSWASDSAPSKFCMAVSVAKLNEGAMWSVGWASRYDISVEGGAVVVACQSAAKVHYFENCNVQTETKGKGQIIVDGGVLSAADEGTAQTELVQLTVKKLVKKIKKQESLFHQQIATSCNSVGDDALKALRRKLPVSKQLFDFSEATNSASAVFASRRAAASS